MSSGNKCPADTPTNTNNISAVENTTEHIKPSNTGAEIKTTQTVGDGVCAAFVPVENGRNKSREDSHYVDMTLRKNIPKIVTPYAVSPVVGGQYDYIDEGMLDDPCQENNNTTNLDFKPIAPPRPEDAALFSPRRPPVSLSGVPPPVPTTRPPTKTSLQSFQHRGIDRPLSPLRIFDQPDRSQDVFSLPSECCRQILVKGIPVGTPAKDIGRSFETELFSAGDSFEDITVDKTHGEAIVTLTTTRAANELLRRAESDETFILQGNEVHVSPYHQEPSDPMKCLALGLTDDATADDMCDYIESRCRLRPSGVIKGENPGVALLCFDNSPDFTKLQSEIEKITTEVTKWSILPVERTRRVRIRGVAMDTAPEALKHYFETKDRTTESIIYRQNFKDYIIMFAKPEDAEGVAEQGVHTLNDEQLDVSLHYPCLDKEVEYFLKRPEPIKLHNLNKHMCRFLQFSTRYKRDLEEMVESHHGRIIWPDEKSETCLCIQCNVNEKDRMGRDKVKKWKQNSAGVVSEVCKLLTVHYKYFALEIVKSLRSKVENLSVYDPESVLVSFEENRVAIAGEIKYVDELSEKIKDIVFSMEQSLDNSGKNVTKIVKVKEHNMELLKEINLEQRLKNVHTLLERENVILKGRKRMVDDAVLKVKDIIKSLPKQTIQGIGLLEINLLRTMETDAYIKRKLNEAKITGVWECLEDGDILIYSKNDEELKAAENILRSSMKRTSITVNNRKMEQGEGKKFLENMERRYKGRVRFRAYREELCIVSLDNLQQEINEKVMKYLDSHSDVTEIISLDPGVFRYILSYKRKAIDKIKQQYHSKAVQIDIIDKQTRKGFMISGEKECCKLAIVDLHVVVDTVTRIDYNVNWPFVDQFLRSTEGINELNKIELAEKCVLTITTEDINVNTEIPRNIELAECRIGNCKIEILEQDITEKEAEFIVNPTDSVMDHKQGLGRTMVDKGGFCIQKSCKDYVQSVPCLSDGDIFVGTAGCLPCRGIIHVVVPSWRGGSHNEEYVLGYAVTKCLIEADTRCSASIAFPLIGAGKFGYPSEAIAEIMIKAVKTYLIENGTETNLRDVYICDIARETLIPLVKAIEKGFGLTTVKMPASELLGQDETDSNSSDKKEEPFQRITMEIVTGSITSQDTDVITNSTNALLDLRVGGLSRSILSEGGERIMSEVKEKYPDGITPGEIAETTGGNLKCKALLHGVLVKWDEGQGYAEMIMTHFVRNCISAAHKKHYVSIAFPVLGAGALEFPPEQIARIMFNTIATFEKEVSSSTLKTVRVVIRPEDEKSLKAFEDYKSEWEQTERRTKVSDISSRQSCQVQSVFMESGGTDYTTTVGQVTLSIEQGDLTTATTAVIVNSVPDDLNMESGRVSRAILRAAGRPIQDEAYKNKKSFKQEGLVMTSSGRLLCQKIIHIKARNGLNGWKQSVSRCLSEVEKSCLKSVSFPALGTGGKGFSSAEMAKCMLDAIRDYILGDSYQGCLRNVKIIVYETEMVDAFIKEVKDGSGSRTSQRKSMFQDLKFWEQKPADETECSGMVFHIFTETKSDNVVKRIEDLNKTEVISVPRDVLANMPNSQVSRVKRIGEAHGISLQFSNEGIALSGYRKDVQIVKEKIQQEIN